MQMWGYRLDPVEAQRMDENGPLVETLFLSPRQFYVLLCVAFLHVDAVAFRAYLGRPFIVLAGTAWTSLVIPISDSNLKPRSMNIS